MRIARLLLPLVGLGLFAPAALAADLVTITLDADSPRPVGTGLTASAGDRFLVHAQGTMRLLTFLPFHEGWFDPSGLGRYERAGQVLADSPFGAVVGTFTSLEDAFPVGDLASWSAQGNDQGQEFKVGLNMSADDQAAIQGSFRVHVLRFTDDEVAGATFDLDADSSRPLSTGIVAENTDQFFVVLAQGAARLIGGRPVLDGWFDPSGLGRLSRAGQIFSDMPYGCVLGTFTAPGSSYHLGDIATWPVQSADVGSDLELLLNMDADDQSALQGGFKVHVLRVDDVVVTAADNGRGDLPPDAAIASVESYPNPFNPLTTIRCQLPREQRIRVSVVNLAGEHLAELAAGQHSAGTHEFTWDGRDAQGRGVPSGTYLVRLQTEDGVSSRKLTLVR